MTPGARLNESFPYFLRGAADAPAMSLHANDGRRTPAATVSAQEDAPTRGIDIAPKIRVASLDPVADPQDRAKKQDGPKVSDIPSLVTTFAEKHGVPVPLAHAVVRVESNYKPNVVGRGATIGLMQIKHPTARGLGFAGTSRELIDPETNLEWGMRYLAGARKLAKGNLCGTILRYQGGHASVRMTRAASIYCSKVRRYIAEAEAETRKSVAQAPAR